MFCPWIGRFWTSLVENGMVDAILKKGEVGLLYKLDIEKAYDTYLGHFSYTCLRRWVLWPDGEIGCKLVCLLLPPQHLVMLDHQNFPNL